jgi:hypothetical protein
LTSPDLSVVDRLNAECFCVGPTVRASRKRFYARQRIAISSPRIIAAREGLFSTTPACVAYDDLARMARIVAAIGRAPNFRAPGGSLAPMAVAGAQ